VIELPDNPRILIARLSAIGDCIQTMPLACALRDRYPAAHITWIVEPAAAPLVNAVSAVDRVIVAPKGFALSLQSLRRLRNELRREPFDIAFDPQGLTKSGIAAWLSGAPNRIGFTRPRARELNPWFQTHRIHSLAVHRIDSYLELLKAVGIERPKIRFGLQIPPAAEQFADELAARPELKRGYVVLNPGAGWDSKRWPPERLAEVARSLAHRGLPALVTFGGKRERAWAEEIVATASGAALLAPETSLLQLAAILRRAKLFVGSDTGPLHLAAAVGTPCVALFGASPGAACGPHGPGHIVLQAALDNSPGRKQRGADNWAMRHITAPMVTEACDRLLSRPIERAA
jgi:lipopolysaccharide heptosyltransferase I